MEWVLAIDLGTHGPKVALVGTDGRTLGRAFEPTRLMLEPDGGAEQEPDDWWRAIGTAASRVTEAHPTEAAAVSAVTVTSQWSGTVPISPEGTAAANAIIWLDHRGASHIADTIGGPIRFEGYGIGKVIRWIRLTGGAPGKSGKDPIAHILWLKHERPDLYAAAATFLEPKDYVNLRLTGRAVATFDSIALHWLTDNRDPAAVAYDDRLLRIAGIDRDKLPPLIAATDTVGTLLPDAAAHLGLPSGIAVVGGSPDLHSAGIGSGAVPHFVPHLYVGTSAWISCHVPFKKTDVFRNIASLPSPIPGRYYVANEQETAGACIDLLADVLHPGVDRVAAYAELNEAAAAAPPGSGGVVFTPWLNGERTPVEDSTLRGGFFNQSLDTGRSDFIRSVFEGVALNARWLLGAVERFTKRRLDPITMAGGGAQSELWCRIHADVLGRTIRRAVDPILVNVRGVGLLAHAALGHIDVDDIPGLIPIADTYEPDPEPGRIYDRAYDTFRRIHRTNRRLYARLNRPA
jgi:xylulokinase